MTTGKYIIPDPNDINGVILMKMSKTNKNACDSSTHTGVAFASRPKQ